MDDRDDNDGIKINEEEVNECLDEIADRILELIR